MGLIHYRAICNDCGWECNSRNAHAAGTIHARKHKHRVEVQLGYSIDGKEEE